MTELAQALQRLTASITITDMPDDSGVPQCATCGGLGRLRCDVPFGHPDFGKLVDCTNPNCEARRAIEARRVKYLVKSAGVPRGYQGFSFDSWFGLPPETLAGKDIALIAAYAICDHETIDLPDVIAYVNTNYGRHYDASAVDPNPRNWLMLTGDNGYGKTSLAASIANRRLAQHRPVVFVSAKSLVKDVDAARQRDHKEDTNTANELINRLCKTPFLVIDEFDLASMTDARRDNFEIIINARYTDLLPTVFTTNHTSATLRDTWNNIIADRIEGAAHIIRVAGAKLRPTQSELVFEE